jgi:tryptophan synthase alpha subunit
VADGVIVGSALINATNAGEDKAETAVQFVQSLRAALQR